MALVDPGMYTALRRVSANRQSSIETMLASVITTPSVPGLRPPWSVMVRLRSATIPPGTLICTAGEPEAEERLANTPGTARIVTALVMFNVTLVLKTPESMIQIWPPAGTTLSALHTVWQGLASVHVFPSLPLSETYAWAS